MNKYILFKILLISSCTLLTTLQGTHAEQQPESYSREEVATKKKLSEVNYDTLAQMKLDGDNDAVLDKHDQCPNSPVGNDVDRYGCTKYAKIEPIEETVVTIALLVNFENDKFNVDEKYFSEINRVAIFLKQYPNTSIIIEGHTSSQGNAKYNQRLSQKRANAIVKILTNEFSIDNNRLSAAGYGEEQLIDLADTIQAHTINRRVEGKVSTGE
jgi:OOP family OmpA-OmpF porin